MRATPPSSSSKTTLARAFAMLLLAGTTGGVAWAQTAAAPAPVATQSPEAAEIQRLTKAGQFAQALKLIDDALAKNPQDVHMRFRRGVALSMLDRKAEALTVFQKLVEDHPDMPSPYNNLAVLYGAQGDYEKARLTLEKAIRTNPAYATAYQNLGDVYAQLASQAYAKALSLDKSDASVPPKLALLRELVSTPSAPGTATAVREGAQTVVAAKAAPTPPVQVAAAAPVPPPPAAKPVVAPPAPAPAVVAVASAIKPITAASAPASAPATAAAPKPVPSAANPVGDVEAAVRAWAAAWSRRDLTAYYAAYTGDFSGQAHSHRAWEEDRRVRIATKRHIKVEITDLRVSVNGDRAQARFRQGYESDALTTSGHKTLELTRAASGRWLIRQESVGG